MVINKIDTVKDKSQLLAIIGKYSELFEFDAVLPVSARTGDGMAELKQKFFDYQQESVHFFDDEALTDQPERVIASELIREKLLYNLDKEIPHGLAVDIELFDEREDIINLSAVIYCERESHKGIIIGKQGAMLKKVGSSARYELEKFFGCKINLKLWVKVKEGWRNRAGSVHNFGLDL